MPSFHAPHKQQRAPAAASIRLALLEIVVALRHGEEVCTLEIERQGFSFTVDTLRTLATHYENAELSLLLGADSLEHLLTWRDVPELFTRARFVFVQRPGWGAAQLEEFRGQLAPHLQKLFRADFLPMMEVPVSSTAMRAALAAGQMPADLQQLVQLHIAAHGCYGFTKV